MRPISAARMQIAARLMLGIVQTVQRMHRKLCFQRLACLIPQRHTSSQARHRHARRGLRGASDGHAHQSKTRSFLLEFDVSELRKLWEFDPHDDLAGLQSRGVQALEKIICCNAPLRGDDRRIGSQHSRRPASSRIVVRQRAADRAHVAHLLIGNPLRQSAYSGRE